MKNSAFDSLLNHEISETEKCCQESSRDDISTGDPKLNNQCCNNSNTQVLPVELDAKDFLEGLKDNSPICSHKGSLVERMNGLPTNPQILHFKSFENLLKIVWSKLATIVSTRTSNYQNNKNIDFDGICSDEMDCLLEKNSVFNFHIFFNVVLF